MSDFLAEALELEEYTRFLRRDFHQHPELGFQEFRTAGVVARELTALGLEVTSGIAHTGVVALVEGQQPGPVVLLRFDMDALPITEETGAEYASKTPGVMHACGHDGHTAIGLTVARMLHEHRSELAGTIKLVFQPAEEGIGGAELMVAEGVLNNPRPDYSLALHLWNERPVGWVGVTDGPVMAAAEIFSIRLTGKGGHGALPHLAIDPIVAAAQIVSATQSIVARNVNPLKTAVVSVTAINGGTAFNVIPGQVEMKGTIRTFDPEVRQQVLARFRAVVEHVAAGMGCAVAFDLNPLTPAVINRREVAHEVRAAAEQILPQDHLDQGFMTMGSEDMSLMMQDIPGCYFFIGSANAEKGLDAPHHHPRFDIDEAALPKAVALMTGAALRLLRKN